VDGVESAEVDFNNKTVAVTCNKKVDQAALIAALQAAGFGGTVK